MDPTAIATTIAASAMPERPMSITAGPMMAPAVVAATVAEPCATRNKIASIITGVGSAFGGVLTATGIGQTIADGTPGRGMPVIVAGFVG